MRQALRYMSVRIQARLWGLEAGGTWQAWTPDQQAACAGVIARGLIDQCLCREMRGPLFRVLWPLFDGM